MAEVLMSRHRRNRTKSVVASRHTAQLTRVWQHLDNVSRAIFGKKPPKIAKEGMTDCPGWSHGLAFADCGPVDATRKLSRPKPSYR
jgi:hypothetical protein